MVLTVKTKKQKGKVTIDTAKTAPKAKVQVSKTQDESLEEELLEEYEEDVPELPDAEFTQPVANVGFTAGVTRNLGDYNSLKIQVSLHLPCYVNEVDATFEYARKFVDAKVNDVLSEYDLIDEDEE